MKTSFKAALIVALMLGTATTASAAPARRAAAPAAAAAGAGASSGQIVAGLAVADFDAVRDNSDAVRAAGQQRPTTYKAQLDAYTARAAALQAQLNPMIEKINKDAAAPNANQADLQTQSAAIQKFQESAKAELANLSKPVVYSELYVKEQVEAKMEAAVKAAMAKHRVSIILNPQAVTAINNGAYNLNAAILAEINALIPTAQLVPPANWEPLEVRQARAQQAAQQGQAAPAPAAAAPAATAPAAAAPAANTPKPSGR